MSEHRVDDHVLESAQGSRAARTIRRLAVPIAILWVAIAALTNIVTPQLEVVGAVHTVAQSSPDSPSLKAMKHIGAVFGEFDSDSNAMIVLEGDQPSARMPTSSTTSWSRSWPKTPPTSSTSRTSGAIR